MLDTEDRPIADSQRRRQGNRGRWQVLGRRWPVVAIAAAALTLPATTQAATISMSGGVLTYTAAPGEMNTVTLALGTDPGLCEPQSAPCLDVQEAGENASITSAPGCVDQGYRSVKCAAPTSVVASLGDRDDALFDWEGPSTIDGGHGDDVLNGYGGADTINAGPGNDALFGGDGNDRLDGGDGDDSLEGFGALSPTAPLSTAGTDIYIGGGGKDLVDYAGNTEPMTISLDGLANDGAAGEADNVGADVEVVRGGEAADTITGNDAANRLDGWRGNDTLLGGAGEDVVFGNSGDDRVFGEDGQDTVEGGDGDDSVDGGGGVDTLYGDAFQVCVPSECQRGADTIAARDGLADVVYCGPGEDTATLDAVDQIPAGGADACERADRSAAAAGPDGAASGASDQTAPQLRGLRVGTLRRGRAATIRFTLSEAATVSFTFERRMKSRWVKVRGTIRRQGKAGSNTVRFDGRVAGRRLKRGSYRLVAVARDRAGNQSAAKRAPLRVRS